MFTQYVLNAHFSLVEEEPLEDILFVIAQQQSLKESKNAFLKRLNQELRAEVSKWGLKCRDVLPDGNCFYRTISDQLYLRSKKYFNFKHLKQQALDYILTHKKDYQSFCPNGDVESYIKLSQKENAWADHLIIDALAKSLQVTIVIVRSDHSSPTIINHIKKNDVLFIGYESEWHYQSLERNSLALQNMLNQKIEYQESKSEKKEHPNCHAVSKSSAELRPHFFKKPTSQNNSLSYEELLKEAYSSSSSDDEQEKDSSKSAIASLFKF